MSDSFQLQPIGFVRTLKKSKTEASRQAQVDTGSTATIELTIEQAELCMKELSGFSHLWVIFIFHQNKNWKPLTQPPRLQRKVGIFACRSPYRPNPIGMSCVEIKKIKGNLIEIGHHDFLDGTPIIDLKPYIEYADCVQNTKQGWLPECETSNYTVLFSDRVLKQLQFLKQQGLSEIENVITSQLSFEPNDQKRKRIQSTNTESEFIFSYRTWRVLFKKSEKNIISVLNIFSGYTIDEITRLDDPYSDKAIHRLYTALPF